MSISSSSVASCWWISSVRLCVCFWLKCSLWLIWKTRCLVSPFLPGDLFPRSCFLYIQHCWCSGTWKELLTQPPLSSTFPGLWWEMFLRFWAAAGPPGVLSKQQRTGDGTNWFYPVQIKWQVRMIPRDAGKQHPSRGFLQKGAEVVSCCIALEVAKRAEFKGILGSPRTGLCPATPAAAPGTGDRPVRCWDPGGILGRSWGVTGPAGAARLWPLSWHRVRWPPATPCTSHSLRNALHKAAAVRSSEAHLPHDQSHSLREGGYLAPCFSL